jgi:hypothetical protein
MDDSTKQWQRVSRTNPCPICGRPDWCQNSTDGELAICMRVEQGCERTCRDKNGTPMYLHRLADGPRAAAAPDPPTGGAPVERADPDTLNAVYDALLGQLPLTVAHREQLRRRDLPDAETDRRLYRTLPVLGRAAKASQLGERFGVEALLSVPGFYYKDKDGRKYLTIAGSTGLLIPVRDAADRIVAVKARRDDAGDGPRYSYLSSSKYDGPGPGAPVHVPLGVEAPAERVRLTEGELKADVATVLSDTPTISAPGVASWRACLPVLHRLGTKIVLIAFDADAVEKPNVARALSDCYNGLTAEGFGVEAERWPAPHKGIDDSLSAGVAVEVLAGDAARQFVEEVSARSKAGEPPGPLDRLDEVLSKAGVEGLFRDGELLAALAKLAEHDAAEMACVRAKLARAGVRLRDLDAALAPRRQALRAERPPLTSAGEYKASGGRMVRVRSTPDGLVEDVLCNFNARIVAQTTVDDGAERSIRLAVEGQLFDGTPLPRVEVSAEKFGWMEWIIPSWGTRAVINAGRSTADHLRCALQLLSGDVPRHVHRRRAGGEAGRRGAGSRTSKRLARRIPCRLHRPPNRHQGVDAHQPGTVPAPPCRVLWEGPAAGEHHPRRRRRLAPLAQRALCGRHGRADAEASAAVFPFRCPKPPHPQQPI